MSTEALEKHYSVKELADRWRVSPETVRRMVRDMPGVLKVSFPRLVQRERKHEPHERLSIPESVAVRAHEQWSRGAGSEVKPRNRGI